MFVDERQRAKRVDAGVIRQTARDAQLLEWMSHMYGLPLDLIQQGLEIGQVRAYQLAQRWEKAGWTKRGKVDTGPLWVWPTKATARQYLGWDCEQWTPRATTSAHHRAVAAVRLHRAGLALDRWISERSLLHELGYRKQGRKEPHTPDGIEVLPDGRKVLIEVELTAKSPERYLESAAQHYQATGGLLQQIDNRAYELGCYAVAYWCSPAAMPVVSRQVEEYQRRVRAEGGRAAETQWFVRSLEEVPKWTL